MIMAIIIIVNCSQFVKLPRSCR